MQKASSNVLNAQNGSDPSRSTADLSPVHARAACTAHPRFSASSNGATKGAGSGTHAVEDIARIYHNLKEVTPNQKAANRAKESEAVSENSTLPPYLKDIGWSQLLERLGEGPMRPDDAGDHGVGNSAGHSKDFPLTSPHPISGGRVGSARCTQKRRATSAERKLKDSKINVKPEVHALFHSYIDEQHTTLALHTADSKAGKLVRTSDARILTKCCHHFAHLCKEQPRLRERANEAFRLYMMTHKACAPGSRKGIRTSADIIPTLLSIVNPPQGKRLHGVLLEFLILTAIGHSAGLPTLATPALLEQVMYYRGPEGAPDAAVAAATMAANRTESRPSESQLGPPDSGVDSGAQSNESPIVDRLTSSGGAATATGAAGADVTTAGLFGVPRGDASWPEGLFGGVAPIPSDGLAASSAQIAHLSSMMLPNTLMNLIPHSNLSSFVGLHSLNSGHLSPLSPFHQVAAAAGHSARDSSAGSLPLALAASNRDDPLGVLRPASLSGLSSLSAAISKMDNSLPPSGGQDDGEPKDIAQIYMSLQEPMQKLAEAAVLNSDNRNSNKRTLADLAAAAEVAQASADRPVKRSQQQLEAEEHSEWRTHFKDFVAFVQQRTSGCGAALPRTGALGSWCSEQLQNAVEWLSQGGMPDPLSGSANQGGAMMAAKYNDLMAVPAFKIEVLKSEAEAFDECIWKLKRFVEEHGRLPRAEGMSGIDSEAELARWCSVQRRLALRLAAKLPGSGAMDASRVAQLLDIPGWIES